MGLTFLCREPLERERCSSADRHGVSGVTSRRTVFVMFALAASIAAAAVSFAVWDRRAVVPGDGAAVQVGQALYSDHCAACHGENLEGQPNWRTRRADGRLPAPPHDETGHTWHHPDQQLFAMTKYGIQAFAGPAYESDMPGFDGVLSDEEIQAVLAYIKSTWPSPVRAEQERRSQAAGRS